MFITFIATTTKNKRKTAVYFCFNGTFKLPKFVQWSEIVVDSSESIEQRLHREKIVLDAQNIFLRYVDT